MGLLAAEMDFETWDVLLANLLLPYALLSIVLFLILGTFQALQRRTVVQQATPQKVLIVTAHPDDECMFFAPVIRQFKKEGHLVYLLCMSTGNFYKLGERRKRELTNSCRILGIPEEHLMIIDDARFPDNPDVTWDRKEVADKIMLCLYGLQPHAVVTFDGYGVSGHSNHRVLYHGVKTLVDEDKFPIGTTAFSLDSIGLWRKYVSVLDMPISCVVASNMFVSSGLDVVLAMRAMYAHGSQFVWFRVLYILFSRYMLVNTLQKIE